MSKLLKLKALPRLNLIPGADFSTVPVKSLDIIRSYRRKRRLKKCVDVLSLVVKASVISLIILSLGVLIYHYATCAAVTGSNSISKVVI